MDNLFSYRDILQKNVNRLKENDNEMQVLAEESGSIRQDNEVLIREIIRSEGLLSGPTWKVGLNTKNPENIYLHGVYEQDLMEIMNLPTDGQYHYSISLVMGEPEVRFPGTDHERSWRPTLVHASFNDGEVSIHFDEPSATEMFLRNFDIKLSTSDIRDRAIGLETAAAAIMAIADHAEAK